MSQIEASRNIGMALGVYEKEVEFYKEFSATVSGCVPICFLSTRDPDGWFTILLEDMSPAVVGDQIAGCVGK